MLIMYEGTCPNLAQTLAEMVESAANEEVDVRPGTEFSIECSQLTPPYLLVLGRVIRGRSDIESWCKSLHWKRASNKHLLQLLLPAQASEQRQLVGVA